MLTLLMLVLGPTSRIPRRPNKVRDILGDEAPQHYIDTVNAELKPWYLRPNYSPTDILIDHPEGTVRGGTVPALVERLTAHEHGGLYLNFWSPAELMLSIRPELYQDIFDDL
jgi:hypothetical protein